MRSGADRNGCNGDPFTAPILDRAVKDLRSTLQVIRDDLQDKAIVGEALLIERVSQHKQHVLFAYCVPTFV